MTKTEELTSHRIATPMGELVAVMDEAGGLVRLDFERDTLPVYSKARDTAPFAELERCLEGYFRGEREPFDLPLAAQGTPFQHEVWRALRAIPWGQTTTYGELAQRLGRPKAARAVGRANATNPISIVVPCHRVIGTSGKLTGYAGGLARKEALLALEDSGS